MRGRHHEAFRGDCLSCFSRGKEKKKGGRSRPFQEFHIQN
jgi:hypothetical protein